MVKLLIKHTLAETAINVFFDKLNSSLSNGGIPSSGFTEGEKFESITISYIDEDYDPEETVHSYVTFFECEILEVSGNTIDIKYKGYEEDLYNDEGVLLEELGDDQADTEIIDMSEIIAIDV